jgi:DNA-binding transcriptional regulator YhcF (GntR family)
LSHLYICSKSLQDCKLTLREYLHKLELAGLVSSVDGYQSIISAIAKDICSKRRHRELQRKVKCCVSITLLDIDARKSTRAVILSETAI